MFKSRCPLGLSFFLSLAYLSCAFGLPPIRLYRSWRNLRRWICICLTTIEGNP